MIAAAAATAISTYIPAAEMKIRCHFERIRQPDVTST